MKTKLIEILIAAVVLAVLLALVFVVGCDEEAKEAKAKSDRETNAVDYWGIDVAWEPNYPIEFKLYDNSTEEATFSISGDNEIACDTTLENWLRILYESMSGKEPTAPVILTFKEPCVPKELKTKNSKLKTITAESNEPNDITFSIAVGTPPPPTTYPSIWTNTYEEPPKVIYWQDSDGKTIEYIPRPEPKELKTQNSKLKTFPVEPNEPKIPGPYRCLECGQYWGWANEGMKYHHHKSECSALEGSSEPKELNTQHSTLKTFIPAWPLYLELEKELVIEYKYDTGFMKYSFPKGTKIYFKEK